MRSVLYVAGPLSGTFAEMERNRLNGAHWSAWLCRHFDVATIGDWIVMSMVLLETPENRKLGLECDFRLIECCDALVLTSNRISGGMAAEAEIARSLNKPVIDLTPLGVACPNDETSVEAVAAIFKPFGIWKARTA